MDVAEWQKRLEENFTINGYVGGNLFEVLNRERACAEYFATKFHGYNVLIDSFQGFFIETIKAALAWAAKHGWPKGPSDYPLILLYYVILFRSFRACENLLHKGYPVDGYALLRDMKDRAIFLAGIGHNITTLPRIFGYEWCQTGNEVEWEKVRKERKQEQYRVLNRMMKEDSGLPAETRKQLERWERLFHEEVHGSKVSFFEELGRWVKDKVPLIIGPTAKELLMALYTNRSCEIAWLITRLFPYLQLEKNAFGGRWRQKHQLLDESFRYAQKGLSKLGKKIGDAFIEFVDKKVSFEDPFFYVEANGTK